MNAPTSPHGGYPSENPTWDDPTWDDPTWDDPTMDATDDGVDDEFAPQRRQRLGKATALLGVLAIAAGGFLAGAYVQKSHTPPAATGASRLAGGGFSRGGGAGAPASAGTAGPTAAAGTGSATPSADAGPAVIGQIVKVSGDTVVVQNLGGKQVTVTLTQDTAVTKAATTQDLVAGQTVTIGGTTAPDGTVNATTVVSK